MRKTLKTFFLNFKGDLLLKQLNKTPRILFWHGVDDIVNQEVEAESFEVDSFNKQIEYLIKNFEIISLDEFYKRFKNNSFNNREIVLTFDDGYANNLYKVAPILSNQSIPFTVFISTEHIETGELYPTSVARLILLGSDLKKISIPSIKLYNNDISTIELKKSTYFQVTKELKNRPLLGVRKIIKELTENLTKTDYSNLVEKYKSVKPMNWDEVIELHKLGATIGSHCKYHICCHENQDIEEVKEQITESKRIIESKLQSDCLYFAYPNGDYTKSSNLFVKEAGYKLGFSTNKNNRITINSETATIPRIGVPLNIDTFKIFINLHPKK